MALASIWLRHTRTLAQAFQLSDSSINIGTNMVSAVDLVWGTTELLENIILFLPLRDLLHAKRISTRFRDVMNESSKVRKALFFEPLWEVPKAEAIAMAAYKQPPWSFQYLPTDVGSYLVLNPFFDRYFKSEVCTDHAFYKHPELWTSQSMVLGALTKSPSNASWRRMLLLQPHATPATYTIGIDPKSFRRGTRSIRCAEAHTLSLRNDLKMTRVVDLMAANDGKRVDLHLHTGLTILRGPYKLQPGLSRPVDYELNGTCGWNLLCSTSGSGKILFRIAYVLKL